MDQEIVGKIFGSRDFFILSLRDIEARQAGNRSDMEWCLIQNEFDRILTLGQNERTSGVILLKLDSPREK